MFVYIQQNIRTHLTMRSKLDASKELPALAKVLTPIQTLDQAAVWASEFASWEGLWETFLKHRSYAKKNGERPSPIGAGQLWWFTHMRLRRAKGTLATVLKNEHLFSCLTHVTQGRKLPRTTSPLEGDVNAGLKHLLRNHRGLSDDHAKRAEDW
ncbi:hypothetical protein AOC05_04505 [Arthrobacter alpinus]|uniref:Transposase n=1 Tax=Arthrobacter alpinus TaxID=656366 RepID=A0A0M5M3I3_9MICC|nr:hypothetical protein [Arthrobacter alpinus]ALE91757.1 hypothetical protein AOC05_04505 [Arthrobacter alpinus]